jgi:hypothetical protein
VEGDPAGELTCQLQVPVPVSVGNLGDSRAVMGVYESGELRTGAAAKNGIFEPFIYKNDHFTKTDSGQT